MAWVCLWGGGAEHTGHWMEIWFLLAQDLFSVWKEGRRPKKIRELYLVFHEISFILEKQETRNLPRDLKGGKTDFTLYTYMAHSHTLITIFHRFQMLNAIFWFKKIFKETRWRDWVSLPTMSWRNLHVKKTLVGSSGLWPISAEGRTKCS